MMESVLPYWEEIFENVNVCVCACVFIVNGIQPNTQVEFTGYTSEVKMEFRKWNSEFKETIEFH